MSRRVDQLLPAAHAGDATGDAALHLAAALRQAGYEAGIYALTVDESLRDRVAPVDELPPARSGDLTLLHYALPSTLSRMLTERAGHRAIVYHNLTPPELLLPHCPEVATLTARGDRELDWLAGTGALERSIGVSSFNTHDLARRGFSPADTLPLPLDLSRYDTEPDAVLAARLERAPRIFLTVGRLAPNKRLEDLLRAAAYYLRYVDHDAWFGIVGGGRGLERYADALMGLFRSLDLDERVKLLGRVSHGELVTWYRAADVYVSTSVHEGFCAPLLEAMHFGLPILARGAAAVPETLGGAGVQYDDAEPEAMAEMMHLLATDEPLRDVLRSRGRRRVSDFAPERVTERWLAYVTDWIGPA